MDIDPIRSAHPAPTPLHTACFGLGSNDHPVANLSAAAQRLANDCTLRGVSRVWESPADGCQAPNYLNAAVLVETSLSESEIVALSKQIERDLGRQRTQPPPITVSIDIDLLVFDDHVRRNSLWSRSYCAVPVAELMPALQCPASGESLAIVAGRLATETQISFHSHLQVTTNHSSNTVSNVTREER